MAVAAISTSKLTKDYGAGRGLFDLDLHVAQQEVIGYLGPNGSGKTTTIRLLMGMIRPTNGSAHIFGLDCVRDSVEVKRKVGYLPGDVPQFGSLRGTEIVAYFGGMRGRVDKRSVKAIAQRFDLDLSRRFREYSSGNKQKLAILLAFAHRPDLLILDEPTSGLDPLNQQEFYSLLREARDAGATVFLSSHVLSEVEHVCDRVGIIRDGRLVRVAQLDELRRIRVHRVEIEFAPDTAVPETPIRDAEGVEEVTISGQRVTCTVRGGFEALMRAIRDAQVVDFISTEPSLEEIFLSYFSERKPKALPPRSRSCSGFAWAAGVSWAFRWRRSCRRSSRPSASIRSRATRLASASRSATPSSPSRRSSAPCSLPPSDPTQSAGTSSSAASILWRSCSRCGRSQAPRARPAATKSAVSSRPR